MKAFSNETFAELVLDHLVPKSDSVAQIAAAIQEMLQFCSDQVTESMSDIETGVLDVLNGVPRTKLIDGFLRKIWQEYHGAFRPVPSRCISSRPVPSRHRSASHLSRRTHVPLTLAGRDAAADR